MHLERRRQRGADAAVERGDRLAAGKDLDVRVGPVRSSEALDVLLERHAVDLGAGVVFAETRIDLDGWGAERGSDRLCGLDGAREVARDQDVGGEFQRRRKSFAQAFGLTASELGQATASCGTRRSRG